MPQDGVRACHPRDRDGLCWQEAPVRPRLGDGAWRAKRMDADGAMRADWRYAFMESQSMIVCSTSTFMSS